MLFERINQQKFQSIMNIIIIEDEKPAARLLQRKVEKLGLQINTLLHSVEEAIHWFNNNEHPDLIFLDIQLSDGLSFEIFEAVSIKSAVIFTTAYDEYALRAFKLNSIDYLLKPIDEDDLETAINKFKARTSNAANLALDFELIKKMLVNPVDRNYKKRFTIKVGQQLKMIPIEEIECFYSENKGTYLHTLDNRNYLLDLTLEQLENELDPTDFFRVSRKFIVPLKTIKEIQLHSNSRLKVILPSYNEDEVVVARERVNEFKEWLG
jgi:DNA-binding LytR/AlgR family response regulator